MHSAKHIHANREYNPYKKNRLNKTGNHGAGQIDR
jgi:hypothetical protein